MFGNRQGSPHGERITALCRVLALGYSKPLVDERPLDSEELNDAYSRVAKPFFYHLRDCKVCDLDKESFALLAKSYT